MELIQIFLPLRDNDGRRFPLELFQEVKKQLVEEFGGVTAFLRSPAEGIWEKSAQELTRDDVVTFEVMARELNRGWWTRYKKQLEQRFAQEEILIRRMSIEIL